MKKMTVKDAMMLSFVFRGGISRKPESGFCCSQEKGREVRSIGWEKVQLNIISCSQSPATAYLIGNCETAQQS